MRLTAAVLALCAVPAFAGSPADKTYEDMAVDLLQRYVRVDTTNPPGNELRAATFYKEILDKEGIASRIDEFAPGRANILATLKGDGSARPIVLANHMDVVPAEPARWSVSPFSGLLKNGLIYGRGAVDMKSEGILHLVAFLRLKRENVPLARDVMFLGTADEEADFKGALRALSPEGFGAELRKAEYLITEGGENRTDAATGKPIYFGVQAAQKGAYWLTLKASGRTGHGSRPIADSALNRLIRALERIRLWKTDLRVLPSVAKFCRDQVPQLAPPQSEWFKDIAKAIADPAVAAKVYDDESISALLRNTISITVVHAGTATNVIPGEVEAQLDVRLLPGQDPAAFLAEIRKVVDDPTVQVVPPNHFYQASESNIETPLFKTIESVIGRHFPGIPVTTKMSTGATESAVYRPLGIVAYGFTPLLMSQEEDASQHSDDERVREASVRQSTGIFYEVLAETVRRK
jgi:acetylornithine deacetylase/succinyl-diaminopimelate desuccinylase-like protein